MKVEIEINNNGDVKLRLVPDDAIEVLALEALTHNYTVFNVPTVAIDSGVVEYTCEPRRPNDD